MTRRQQRMFGVALLALGIGVAAALTLTAFRKNLMAFYTPTDLVAAPMKPGASLRLGGLVERGSLQRGEGLVVRFTMADCEHKVAVRYEGILPDLFREGQGIVATGAMDGDGVFVASEVLAKHDENYMPPQVAKSLQTPQGHACGQFRPLTPALSPRAGRGRNIS
ncbi:MAG TPA: cytochrome c maturation protein CcmE [Verrucomicrobiae bacterium]|nr:cytochrome c maturation protein CcmE [Verrucomicrobiae bacterium]